jgi:hypothetical protein
MAFYIRAKHGFIWTTGKVIRFLGGLLLVILLSAITWHDENVKWVPVGVAVILGWVYVFATLGKTGWRSMISMVNQKQP